MIRVTAEGLVKRYDRVAVVDGASLEDAPGSLTYLLLMDKAGTVPALAYPVIALSWGYALWMRFAARSMRPWPIPSS